jgi:hypothetical protein
MTDRHSGYVVTLEKDIREDDAESIINAIRMIKGVSSVAPVIASHEEMIFTARRDRLWKEKLTNLVINGPGT